MSVESIIGKWTKALSNTDEYFRRAIIENQEEILDLNVAQLSQGKDALGNLLFQYESDIYAELKQGPPFNSQAPFGIPDLILEGDFTEGFVLKGEGIEFFITSTDEKKDRLRDKYGEDIFGLSEESLEIIRPAILESFLIRLIRAAINSLT